MVLSPNIKVQDIRNRSKIKSTSVNKVFKKLFGAMRLTALLYLIVRTYFQRAETLTILLKCSLTHSLFVTTTFRWVGKAK